MSETFLCLDCLTLGTLDKHGRCDTCGSDSVVSSECQFVDWEAYKQLRERVV